jgi:hypothetical protein
MHSTVLGVQNQFSLESIEPRGLSPSISVISNWFHVPCPLEVTDLI